MNIKIIANNIKLNTATNGALKENSTEQKENHVGAVIGFKTKKGEIVHAKVASSFISFDQAALNMKELGNDSFNTLVEKGKEAWNKVLSKIEVEGGNLDQYRTFYSCFYRSVLFPRKFYEYDANGNVIHYSPYNGEVLPGFMYTDTGFWDTFRCLFPFLNLMFPSVNLEIQEGLINTYKESGFFPEWASPGHSEIIFFIGFSVEYLENCLANGQAMEQISISSLQFSAPLTSAVLSEQIYRAYRIINKEPYHK